MSDSELMTVTEASELTRLRPSTIRRWLLENKVEYVKLGRRVFLRRGYLTNLIENSVVPSRPRPRGEV